MNRRQFLSTVVLSVSLSGCIGGDGGDAAKSDSPTSKPAEGEPLTAAETETPSPEGVTPECWPSMCEGTKLVEVVVVHGFSGDVVLNVECRGEEFSIQSGESVQIDREQDGESCGTSLSVGEEQVFSENIEDYESVTLTVNSNGEVDDEWVVY